MVIAALFTRTKIWKQPKCPLIDEWVNVVYIQNEILSSHKKGYPPIVTTWMNLEDILLSEISQTKANTV